MAAETIEEVMNEVMKAEEEARRIVAEALGYAGSVADGAAALLEEFERQSAAEIKEAQRAAAREADAAAEKEAAVMAGTAEKEAAELVEKAEAELEKAVRFVLDDITG